MGGGSWINERVGKISDVAPSMYQSLSFDVERERRAYLFYYESRKRVLKTRLIHEDRCDERLKN